MKRAFQRISDIFRLRQRESCYGTHQTIHTDGSVSARPLTRDEYESLMLDYKAGKMNGMWFKRRNKQAQAG